MMHTINDHISREQFEKLKEYTDALEYTDYSQFMWVDPEEIHPHVELCQSAFTDGEVVIAFEIRAENFYRTLYYVGAESDAILKLYLENFADCHSVIIYETDRFGRYAVEETKFDWEEDNDEDDLFNNDYLEPDGS